MPDRYSLLRDCFGKSYQLVGSFESPHPAAQRMSFYCPEMTKQFLRSLKVPQDFWGRFLRDGPSGECPNSLSDIAVLDLVAHRLIYGSLRAYQFPDLKTRALRDGKGAAFSFVRGPEPFPTDQECLLPASESEAAQYLADLHAKPAYWHELLREFGLLPKGVNPHKTSEGEYRAIVGGLLVSRELLLYKTADVTGAPKSSGGPDELEDATDAPGNRKAHLIVPPLGPVRKFDQKKVKTNPEEACEELGKCEVSQAEAAKKGGIAPEHLEAIKEVCQDNGAIISFRDSNPACIEKMREGVASKGKDVKYKTFKKQNLPEGYEHLAGLVSTLDEMPEGKEKLSVDKLVPYRTETGEYLTGDYDMHDMIDATTGERIVGESERDLKLREALNYNIGSPDRILHGSQAGYLEYCEEYNEAPKPKLMQPDPPVTVVEGKEPVTFYHLDNDEQLLNMYHCKGTELPPHWNFEPKSFGVKECQSANVQI